MPSSGNRDDAQLLGNLHNRRSDGSNDNSNRKRGHVAAALHLQRQRAHAVSGPQSRAGRLQGCVCHRGYALLGKKEG